MNQTSLRSVLNKIEQQCGYDFWYNKGVINESEKINIDFKDQPLPEALKDLFLPRQISFEIIDKTIFLKPTIIKKQEKISNSKIDVEGIVVDHDGRPVPNATIRIKNTNFVTVGDASGRFKIASLSNDGILIVSSLGFAQTEVSFSSNQKSLEIALQTKENKLEDVQIVSTGYQNLPKERATGSFFKLDSALVNRRVGISLTDRLEGVTSGLVFNKSTGSAGGVLPGNEKLGLSIRGRITLDSKVSADPLIILDNFPFEGDINAINPNDVESITVLKDAAAASIWGARSGNGVIVITTNKGRYKQSLQVNASLNTVFSEKPDLYYSRSFIPSADFIGIERILFDKGFYDIDLTNTTTYPVISPAVELMSKLRSGGISPSAYQSNILALNKIDARDQIANEFFQHSLNQQYALSLRGGSEKNASSLSIGYDLSKPSQQTGSFSRFTLNLSNTYKILPKIQLSTAIFYTRSTQVNAYGYSSPYPYIKILGEDSEHLSIPSGHRNSFLEDMTALGYRDWKLRPLDELEINDNKTLSTNLVLRAGLAYQISKDFSFSLNYQNETQNNDTEFIQDLQSYVVRSNINRYSQRATNGSFTYPFPLGGILSNPKASLSSNNYRAQMDYSKNFDSKISVNAIAGAEARETLGSSTNRIIYGYNNELGTASSNLNYNQTYPLTPSGLGSQVLPVINNNINGTTNRYLSYFVNAAISLMDRYTFSLSGRKDGANVFGVNTNDKVVPLWSTGLSYDISKESFYHISLLPRLKLRATYGYNGNMYNASAYLTATYANNSLLGAPMATINSAPNPELRWEKIRNINLGVDFGSRGNRLSGTIEIYEKLGLDLIENALLPPSTGFAAFKGNAASTRTRGYDLILNTVNLKDNVSWNTNLLISYIKDKVISYDTKYATSYLVNNSANVTEPARSGMYLKEGNSLFGVYSYPNIGLDPINGDPIGLLNGVPTKDYTAILNNSDAANIIYHGSSRPVYFGSLRNEISYKGVSVSFLVTGKFSYFFRKKSASLNYAELLTNQSVEYLSRWQKPGDELVTDIPSIVFPTNANRNTLYQNSQSLVRRADHIRFQDIRLAYDFKGKILRTIGISRLQVFAYLNNIGILWRANPDRIDPDVNDYYGGYPVPRSYAIGIRTSL